MRSWLLVFTVILFVGCESRQKVIVLQPLGDFPAKEAGIVVEKVKKLNPNVVSRDNIPFPKEAYYKPRNRYRAEIILKKLSKKVGRDTIIAGLSRQDISTTNGEVYDWGVMGLGYRPGNACVISTFRLSPKNRREQFYKVVLHELGHTEGLAHCPEKTCLMRDAEGGNPLDQEKDFCKSCKSHLTARHWKLKN